jgi:hypothetical protein
LAKEEEVAVLKKHKVVIAAEVEGAVITIHPPVIVDE